MGVTVAIHQPNFLPWLGFFRKWAASEVFVLLDDVQLPRTGGTWVNRTGLLVSGSRRWTTLPIMRSGLGPQSISSVHLVDGSSWKRKLVNTFHHSYSTCPFYDEAREFIDKLVEVETTKLLDINVRAIKSLGELLNLDGSKLMYSSNFGTSLSSTNRLVELVKAVDGDTYLSGDGADGYQDDSLFNQNGLTLEYLGFSHPYYKQLGSSNFTAGLSILDAIANIGSTQVSELLHKPGLISIETT